MNALQKLATALKESPRVIHLAASSPGCPPSIMVDYDYFTKTYDRSQVNMLPFTDSRNKLSIMLDGVEVYCLVPKPQHDPDSDEADTRQEVVS